jgi:hypothetical protein
MKADGFDFTLKGSHHIRATAYAMAIDRVARQRGAMPLLAAYAKQLGCRRSAAYNASRYAIMAAGRGLTVAEAIELYAALAILDGVVFRD